MEPSPHLFTQLPGVWDQNVLFSISISLIELPKRTGNKYEKILTLIRTKLSFLIMKSALLCVRGSRAVGSKNQNTFDDDFDIIFEDLRLS